MTIRERLLAFTVNLWARFETGQEVRVLGGRYFGKRAVVSCETHRGSGFWIIRFYNGLETVIEEKLLQRE